MCEDRGIERYGQLQRLLKGSAVYARLADARTAQNKTAIRCQIEATDAQIDRLVYERYDLTEEEIRIAEQATAS